MSYGISISEGMQAIAEGLKQGICGVEPIKNFSEMSTNDKLLTAAKVALVAFATGLFFGLITGNPLIGIKIGGLVSIYAFSYFSDIKHYPVTMKKANASHSESDSESVPEEYVIYGSVSESEIEVNLPKTE